MKKFFEYVNSFISAFSFWGMFFFCVLLFGFKLTTVEIKIGLFVLPKVYYWYFVLSIPVFLIVFTKNFISLKKNCSLLEILGTYLYEIVSVPYRALDIRDLIKKPSDINECSVLNYKKKIWFLRFTKLLIWWVIFVSAYRFILNTSKLSDHDTGIRTIVVAFVVVLLNISLSIANMKVMKKWRNQK